MPWYDFWGNKYDNYQPGLTSEPGIIQQTFDADTGSFANIVSAPGEIPKGDIQTVETIAEGTGWTIENGELVNTNAVAVALAEASSDGARLPGHEVFDDEQLPNVLAAAQVAVATKQPEQTPLELLSNYYWVLIIIVLLIVMSRI